MTTRTKWEYKVFNARFGMIEHQLNELGIEGWEVVAEWDSTPGHIEFLLKRPLHK